MKLTRPRSTLLALALLEASSALNLGPDYNHPVEGEILNGDFHAQQLNIVADLDKDLPFSQPVTFAHLEWQRCLAASHNTVRDPCRNFSHSLTLAAS